MRFIVSAATALLLAACASTPTPAPVAPTPAVVEPPERGDLIGMDSGQLTARFGQPQLRVVEGDGLKLQYRSDACVLDAYLYPPAGGLGTARVTHVDTRRPDGRDVSQMDCLSSLDARP